MTFASLVPLDTAVIAQVGVLAVSLRLADRAISLALQRPMPTMVAVGASIVGLRVLNARYQKRLADLVRLQRQDDSNVSAGDSAVDEDQPRVVVVDTSGVLDDEARRLKNMLLGIHMAGLVVVTAGMGILVVRALTCERKVNSYLLSEAVEVAQNRDLQSQLIAAQRNELAALQSLASLEAQIDSIKQSEQDATARVVYLMTQLDKALSTDLSHSRNVADLQNQVTAATQSEKRLAQRISTLEDLVARRGSNSSPDSALAVDGGGHIAAASTLVQGTLEATVRATATVLSKTATLAKGIWGQFVSL